MKKYVLPEEVEARANRLKEAIKKGGGATKVRALTGIPQSTISNFVHGRRDMSVTFLVKVAEACKVSIAWLSTGESEETSSAPIDNGIRVRPSILAAISESYELINDKYNVEVGIDWLHETLARTEAYVRHREARDAEEKK